MTLKKLAGKNLKILRIQNDMEQKDLAKKIGVSQTTISDWENGNISIPYNRIEQISKEFNIHPTYFFKECKVDS